MKYKHFFSSHRREDLCDYLLQHGILYKCLGGDGVPELITFSVWSTRKDCEIILKELYSFTGLKPWTFAVYSEKDLSSAQLLEIRPKSQKICIDNEDESFSYSCCWSYKADKIIMHKANHIEQIGKISIAKEPSVTTKTVFWGPDDGGNLIFADKKVLDLVAQENLQGVCFQGVLLKNKKVSERVFQVFSEHVLKTEDIIWGQGEEAKVCPMCGKVQYTLPSTYQLHLFDLPLYHEKDFFSTENIFGDGIAQPVYIVSQRFYRLLKKNKLTSQVEFVPVILEP